jgi:hypothetical protein
LRSRSAVPSFSTCASRSASCVFRSASAEQAAQSAANAALFNPDNYQPVAPNLSSISSLDPSENAGKAVVVKADGSGFELDEGGGDYGQYTTVAAASSIVLDFSKGPNFCVDFPTSAARTFANPTNVARGQRGMIFGRHVAATGSAPNISFGTQWKEIRRTILTNYTDDRWFCILFQVLYVGPGGINDPTTVIAFEYNARYLVAAP